METRRMNLNELQSIEGGLSDYCEDMLGLVITFAIAENISEFRKCFKWFVDDCL